MPVDYLRKIEHETFPLRVDDPCDLQCVAILKAQGLIEGAISPPGGVKGVPSQRAYALVLRITPLGHMELSKTL